MHKQIKFESFKYRFLIAAQERPSFLVNVDQLIWEDFVRALEFSYDKGSVCIHWKVATPGTMTLSMEDARFYLRGDDEQHIARQCAAGLMDTDDPIKLANAAYFKKVVMQMALVAGFESPCNEQTENERFAKERTFHDEWAGSEDLENIDIRAVSEACTSPEMRYIAQRLGDIRGKRLLDVGCGLGEASVYFAMLGADVTSTDLSQGMLNATCRLAQANGVSVTPHVSAAEDMRLPSNAEFDIIYAGNLLHHVDIDQTLSRIKPYLAHGGLVVTWDPLAYNPIINVYRAMATAVRTPDEHPLKLGDINLFRKHFSSVETRYFWLTTLSIFIIMALFQRRNPNKERFWKVVVKEGKKWRWLYQPLEKLDHLLLTMVPPLRLLCWNVVVVSRNCK